MYGRYRSESPEASSANQSITLPIREIESNKRPDPLSPNTETLERKPRNSTWKPGEDERLVSLISECRYSWAQISMQFKPRAEACVRKHWHNIKSNYPDVHYISPNLVQPHLPGDVSPRRPRSR